MNQYECSVCLELFPLALVQFNSAGLPFCERCYTMFGDVLADMEMPGCPCCDGHGDIDHVLNACRQELRNGKEK